MAVSVDRVYQTVLALANKEQRGYITPQEFNLFANHAQNEIFEQYFYDLNQFLRAPTGNSTVTSDLRDLVEEKIAAHMNTAMFENTIAGVILSGSSVHKLESVLVNYAPVGQNANWIIAEELENASEIYLYQNSPLARPSMSKPVFTRSVQVTDDETNATSIVIQVYPQLQTEASVQVHYIAKPPPPNWTYVLLGSDAIYNPAASDRQDFALHQSEEKNLVLKILQLAGISIQDTNITQLAGSKEAFNLQQEKS